MENFSNFEFGKNFFNITQKKSQVIQEKISKSDVIKNLKFALQKTQNENASHRLEDNIYKLYLTENLYLDYTKNTYDSTIKAK